jgi:hypothetical protein
MQWNWFAFPEGALTEELYEHVYWTLTKSDRKVENGNPSVALPKAQRNPNGWLRLTLEAARIEFPLPAEAV